MPFARLTRLTAGCLAAWLLNFGAGAGEPQYATGLTEPVFDVTLSLAVPGIIAHQRRSEGDFVRSNEVILELDKRLEELEVARRKLVLENRKTDWESTKHIFEKSSSVSREELLKRELEYQVAQADYETALQQLERRSLVAPGEGKITEINLRVGEACSPYQAAVRLVDTRRCYFICDLEAREAAQLELGQEVQLEIEECPAPVQVPGKIVFLSPVVDKASGLQKVKVLFDNQEGKIRPGLAGKMYFTRK